MLLKTKDLREKTIEELYQELANLREQLLQKRMAFHSRQLDNPAVLSHLKKSIARILTIIQEKEEENKE